MDKIKALNTALNDFHYAIRSAVSRLPGSSAIETYGNHKFMAMQFACASFLGSTLEVANSEMLEAVKPYFQGVAGFWKAPPAVQLAIMKLVVDENQLAVEATQSAYYDFLSAPPREHASAMKVMADKLAILLI